jgi:hypothetical protein
MKALGVFALIFFAPLYRNFLRAKLERIPARIRAVSIRHLNVNADSRMVKAKAAGNFATDTGKQDCRTIVAT